MIEASEHYKSETGIQAYQVIENWQLTFNLGCVLKYCCRAGFKKGASVNSDIDKALTYVDFEVDYYDRVMNGDQLAVPYRDVGEVYCNLPYMPDRIADLWQVSQERRLVLKLLFKASVCFRKSDLSGAMVALEDMIPHLLEIKANG